MARHVISYIVLCHPSACYRLNGRIVQRVWILLDIEHLVVTQLTLNSLFLFWLKILNILILLGEKFDVDQIKLTDI